MQRTHSYTCTELYCHLKALVGHLFFYTAKTKRFPIYYDDTLSKWSFNFKLVTIKCNENRNEGVK